MKPIRLPISRIDGLTRMTRREDGSSTIELAIVFPMLILLFIGTAELGRLLYTYTTLSKATAVGARYLSTSRNAVNGTTAEKNNAKQEAKNLVVCGIKSTSATACNGQTPVVTGLTTANVLICDNFSTACSPALNASSTKYFRVEIQNFTYSPGVWDVSSQVGVASSKFYFLLKPGTQARSMMQ